MRNDELHRLLHHHLMTWKSEDVDLNDLAYEVVGDYITYLFTVGQIPQHFLDEIETDLREEVTLMYRKITYGCLNIREYQEKQKRHRRTI